MKKSSGKVLMSKNTFLVDRLIFSNVFSDLKEHKLRVYLLMCRVVGAQNGTFFMSIVSIQKEVNISEHYVRDALSFLESNYFIKKVGNRGLSNVYIVLTVPFYDSTSKTYISNESIPKDRSQQKNHQHGYCEMPIEVMSGSIFRDKTKWTDRKIKVLGLLYLFHWIDMYGGVDPVAVHGTSTSIYVSEFITNLVGYSAKDVVQTIRWLIREGYAFRVKGVYRTNLNSCEADKQFIGDVVKVTIQPGDEVITIIRMSCIPEIKVMNAIHRTGGLITL